jgi:hypothetical protein
MYRYYINNATNASQERDERTHSGIGGQSAIVGGAREEDWLFYVRPFCFDKILGYLRLNRLHSLGLDDLGVAVDGRAHGGWGGLEDDDASGKWGVGRRRNAIVGRNGDASMAWTWGRRRDRNGTDAAGRTDRARRIISTRRGGKVPPPRSIAAAAAGTNDFGVLVCP